MSMIRKYHNHKLQTTLWHGEEEPLNHYETPGRQIKQCNQLSLPHQDDCNTRMDKTAPFTADTLFGGRIQAAVTVDREDQIHASLARSNVGPRPGAFKRQAPKSLAQGPAAKKAKKNTFFNRRSSIPPPAPRRPSLYQKPPGKG